MRLLSTNPFLLFIFLEEANLGINEIVKVPRLTSKIHENVFPKLFFERHDKEIRFVFLFYETLDQYFAGSPVVKQASAYLSLTTAFFVSLLPFQSGSQNDLLSDAAWSPEESPASPASSSSAAAAAAARLGGLSGAPAPAGAPGAAGASACAEYPFHMNLCLPAQAVNFDLTHKRGKKKKKDPPFEKRSLFSPFHYVGKGEKEPFGGPILSREEGRREASSVE